MQDFLGNFMARTAVEQNFAGPGLVGAANQAQQGRLAATAGTDHRDPLARPDDQAQAPDQRRAAPAVAERDVSQLDMAGQLKLPVERADRVHFRLPARDARIQGGLGDVVQMMHIGFERMTLVDKLDETAGGRQKHRRQDIESDQRAEGDVAGHDLGRPEGEDHGAAQHREQALQGGVDVVQLGHSLARIQLGGLLAAPAPEEPVFRRSHPQAVPVAQYQHPDSQQHPLLAMQGLGSCRS